MKLHTTENEIERFGVSEEGTFKIKTSAKTFSILSSSLYQDKVGAVVRELACNAYDSHVAAGKPDEPFSLVLPGVLSQKFSIRDYGVGLPHDKVMSLYTTYFDSTKDNSNSFIGALGLGSKSPFSYVSSFSVNSYYNGEVRSYSAFIGEDGTPKIALLNASPTNAANGLEVNLAVKPGDESKFHRAMIEQLSFFRIKPTTSVPVKWPVIRRGIQGQNWYVREGDNYSSHSGSVALMGQVAYPINSSQFPYGSEEKELLSGLPLVLELKLGDADIAPSREALSYDPTTIANLSKILTNVKKEILGQIENKISTAPTYWEACTVYSTLVRGAFAQIPRLRNHKVNWNGKLISTEVEYVPPVGSTVQFSHKSRHDARYERPNMNWTPKKFHVSPEDTYIFIADTTHPWARVTKWVNDKTSAANGSYESYRILVMKGPDAEIANALKDLGNPPSVKLSTITIPTGVYSKTQTAKVKVLSPTGYSFDATTLDLNTAVGYFVHLNGYAVCDDKKVDLGMTSGSLSNVRKSLETLGLIAKSTPIYSIHATYWPQLKGKTNLTEFTSEAKRLLLDHLKTKSTSETVGKILKARAASLPSNLNILEDTALSPLVKDLFIKEPKHFKDIVYLTNNLKIEIDVPTYDPKKIYADLPKEVHDLLDFMSNFYTFPYLNRPAYKSTFKFLTDKLATHLGV